MNRKGIILAGGSGTRLSPLTDVVVKQLLPIYNKPMIYYSIGALMLMGIREILIISSQKDIHIFKNLFGNGSQLGLMIDYEIQKEPKGIAEALIIGENFLDDNPSCLILGDNLFHGHNLQNLFQHNFNDIENAQIFSYQVKHPEKYGVVTLDSFGKIISIEEKPSKPKSKNAVVGVYYYPADAPKIAKSLKPSIRDELEITDLNNYYLQTNRLNICTIDRGIAWFDCGTFDDLAEATLYVKLSVNKQGYDLFCLEELALKNNLINTEQFKKLINKTKNPNNIEYLESLLSR